jgi:hypothetical protein
VSGLDSRVPEFFRARCSKEKDDRPLVDLEEIP